LFQHAKVYVTRYCNLRKERDVIVLSFIKPHQVFTLGETQTNSRQTWRLPKSRMHTLCWLTFPERQNVVSSENKMIGRKVGSMSAWCSISIAKFHQHGLLSSFTFWTVSTLYVDMCKTTPRTMYNTVCGVCSCLDVWQMNLVWLLWSAQWICLTFLWTHSRMYLETVANIFCCQNLLKPCLDSFTSHITSINVPTVSLLCNEGVHSHVPHKLSALNTGKI
jgi:hypothetical protein